MNQNSRRKQRMTESLDYGMCEPRRMMAGIFYGSDFVTIRGTDQADTVQVTDAGNHFRVSLNGQSSGLLSKARFEQIKFYAYDGDDFFSNLTSVPSLAYGHAGADRLYGGSGSDRLYGNDGADYISGRNGNDFLYGGPMNDRIYGGQGHDYIQGDAGNDLVSGNAGVDRVHGMNGEDRVYGGWGNDLVSGGSGMDRVFGGEGNDRVYGGDGADIVSGNEGHDRVYGGRHNDKVYGGSGNDLLKGGSGNDTLWGYTGHDRIFGQSGNDTLYGYHGHDSLYGGADQDYLYGGNGLDGLYGGAGADHLNGGAGGDRFLWLGNDTIEDQTWIDARIRFSQRDLNWNQGEIQVMDRAFSQLHMATGNTRLLKDALTGHDLTFYKAPSSVSWLGLNRLTTYTSGNNVWYEREIFIADWNAGDEVWNQIQISTAIHEIAHNFDTSTEANAAMSGSGYLVDQFRQISGWSRNYSANKVRSGDGQWYHWFDASFARSYGKHNPFEDYATIWQVYFQVREGENVDTGPIQNKLDVVDQFFTRLSQLS